MNAGLHKLTAGDGYTYLTRQVAVMDSTQRGAASMNEYYSMKGEAPGRWGGRGIAAFDGIDAGDAVTEAQMKSLFGLGEHPDADQIRGQIIGTEIAKGAKSKDAKAAAEQAVRLGNPYRVYTESTAFRRELATRFGLFNTARCEPSSTVLPAEDRERIRTELATQMFSAEVGRSPLPHELSGWIARNDRDKTTAVAGYDITFSPVKSFSTLWAVADRDLRDRLQQAHDNAVADAVTWLENTAAFTRTGANGVAQVDIEGLITTAFTHRDARSGDPDLHTHLVVSNKVRTTDGRWLALDGRPLHRAKVTVSEIYNTALEGHCRDLAGLEFEDREPGTGSKRTVREIVGVDRNLCELWSSRDRAITQRFGELATTFQASHGREPTPLEALQLRQQANLETREAKHEPRSAAEQFATWRTEAARHLGSERAVSDMIYQARNNSVASTAQWNSPNWVSETATRIVATIAEQRATWQPHHIWAEARRVARTARIPQAEVEGMCTKLTTTALSAPLSVGRTEVDTFTTNEPGLFRKLDGQSVYSDSNTRQYTSWAVLDAERRLVEASLQTGGRRAYRPGVEVAILEHAANNPGRELNTGQMMLVREFALSGRRVQLALAPAGTGKTTAMKVLARAWESDGGQVLGLAPQGSAAGVLRADIGTDTTTIDKLIHTLDAVEDGRINPEFVPDWFTKIGPNSLVVIDEAGMAGTEILDRAVEFVLSKGGSIRLIGDDRQQGAVAAGGVLRDIAHAAGAVSLTQVVRFHDPSEGAATLALRDGDPAAIGFYLDHGRIHEGEMAAVTDELYRDWAADIAAGHDSIMLAGSRSVVNELNGRARADRLAALDPGTNPGLEADLSDGHRASVGDLVITRQNDSRYRISRTDHVRNGYRWRVAAVHADGGLDVVHTGSDRRTRLPADYVAEHVELGYASTIRSSQGLTTGRSRTLFTGIETREAMYVPLSRGKDQNHAYVVTGLPGDEHSVLTEEARRPKTVVDIITAMLGREDQARSATTLDREALDPMRRLAPAADAYVDAVGTAAEHVAGNTVMAAIDAAATVVTDAEHHDFDLTSCAAWPVLRKHLATLAVAGDDPIISMRDAARSRELGSAGDAAAVLDWRLDPSGDHHQHHGPLPWLRACPEQLSTHPEFGKYLTARRDLVIDLAHHVRDLATEWEPSEAPRWARPLIGDPDHTELLGDLAIWRAAVGVDDIDRRPTGRDRFAIAESRYQHDLDSRFGCAVGDLDGPAKRWTQLAETIEPRLTSDPFWPVLAERLNLAHRAGSDVELLLRHAVDPATPLPNELPAAALWWRLARSEQLPAAMLDPIHGTGPLRPDWTPDLTAVFGVAVANRIVADSAWPALVAAVESGDPRRWPPRALLETAATMLAEAQDGTELRPDQYAAALAWRISDLIHHTPTEHVELPPEPVDPDTEAAAAAAAGVHDDPHGLGLPIGDIDLAGLPNAPQPTLFDPPEYEVAASSGAATDSVEADDYVQSLLGLAPPEPEPADEWLTHMAPTPVRYADLPVAEQVARLDTELAAARAEVARLRALVLDDAGPHRRDADLRLLQMRALSDAQRPYVLAAREAHEQWMSAASAAVDADLELALARQAVTAADAAAEDAVTVVDTLGARLPDLSPADVGRYLDALDLLQHQRVAELDVTVAELAAADRCTIADRMKSEYERAQTALVEFAGDAGVIGENEIQLAQITAADADMAELNIARARRSSLESDLFRAENRALHEAVAALDRAPATARGATSNTSDTAVALLDRDGPPLAIEPPDTTPGFDPGMDDSMLDLDIPLPPEPPLPPRQAELPLPSAARPSAAEELEAVAAVMRRDPLRMLRRAELDAKIQRLRTGIERPDSTGSEWMNQQAIHDAEQSVLAIEAAHAVLGQRCAAIGEAEQSIAAAAALAGQHQSAVATLTGLQRELDSTSALRTATRRRLVDQIAGARADVVRLAGQQRAGENQARQHIATVEQLGAPRTQWDAIRRRGNDDAALAAELAAARTAVVDARQFADGHATRRAAQLDEMRAQLAEVQAELARRRGLTRAQADAERRVRATRPAAPPSAELTSRPVREQDPIQDPTYTRDDGHAL